MIEYNANHFSNNHDSLENRYSRRRSPRKSIIEFPVQMKAISLGILITTISWIIPPYALKADPLPIPQLNTPQFRSQDLEPAFDAARNATSETGWEQIVAETRALYSASWETAVDAQIAAYVSSVNESDYFNSDAEYRDYLRSTLEVQKQDAYADWELAANLAIENERKTFTENLAAKKRESTLEESEENTQTGENLVNDGGLSPELEEAYLNWKKDFEASLADGLAQYQSAIAALQKDYNDVLEQIAAKELEFAQKEQEIKDYENNVRDGIQLSVNQMRQSLLNSGLYYEEDCNGVNECTVDWSTMNQSGVDLVALLDQIQQGLDNDAPLSQLAQQMRDYLEVREQETEQRQQYWQNLIRGVGTTQSYIDISAYVVSNHHVTCHEEAELSPAFQSCLNNAIFSWFNLSALYNNSPVGAAMRAIEGSDRETIKNHIQSTGEFRDVETVLNTGIEGVWAGDWYRSGDYFRIMKQWVDIYSNRGRIYCAQLGWPSNCYNIAIVKPNTLMQVLTVYNWYDSNADDNSQTWQGYSDEVSPLFDSWDNDILPAIQTWEAQVAAFNSEHTAWQITANQQKAQADNAYQDGLNQLALSRNQWLAQMSDDYRDAKKDWIALQNQAEDSERNDSNSAQEITPPVIKTAPAFDSILSQSRERINSLVSVADYRITTQPDASLLDDVTRNFQKGIKALANLGAAESINDRAVNNREEHINKLSYALESSGYTITRQKDGGVTATREIHTGNAIRNGGDGTSEADYIAEKQDQTYSVNAPRAVKLVQTGSLNDDWDLNEVLEEYNNSQKQIDEEMDIKFESLDNDLRYMNEIAIEREKQYQESLEKQIADAQQWKSLIESIAQSMLGGMSFSDAATSAFQSQIRGKIADAIAEATGLPSGFLSGILGGAKPHEAFASYVQGQAYSMLEQAWGLPSGLLSTYASKKAQEKAAKKAKQQAVVNAVATVAAVVAAPFTGGASVAVLAAVKAAQGAAQGGLKGAVMGAAGAFADAGTRFLSGGSVGMDLSYSYENGFGAGVSIGLGGGAGLNLGISERGGVTAGLGLGSKGGSGFGLSTTYKDGEGLSGSFGYRSASGTALGLNYSKSGGASAYLGASLNKSGTRTAGLSFSKDEGVGAYVQQGDLQQGAGRLTFNQRDGFGAGFKAGNLDMSVSERGGASINYKAEIGSTETDSYKRSDSLNLGFNSKRGYSVSLDSTTTLDNGQSYNSSVGYRQHEGLTSNITSGNNFASKYLITSQDGLRSTVDTIAADQQEAYRQEKKMAFLNDSRAEMEKRRGEPISDEEWNNPENREDLLHEAGMAVAIEGGEGSENISQSSRLTMWDDFTGVFEDAARGVFEGQLSDSDGYIDEQGNYHQRTCFVAGTKVRTSDGYTDIEKLSVGDRVLSWNEVTGEKSYSTITQTFIHTVQEIYVIRYEDGTKIEATWNHPFYIFGKGWVQVKDLHPGDDSFTAETGQYLRIANIQIERRQEKVYNIHLDKDHTYFVTTANVLVHNYDIRTGMVEEGDTLGSITAEINARLQPEPPYTVEELARLNGFGEPGPYGKWARIQPCNPQGECNIQPGEQIISVEQFENWTQVEREAFFSNPDNRHRFFSQVTKSSIIFAEEVGIGTDENQVHNALEFGHAREVDSIGDFTQYRDVNFTTITKSGWGIGADVDAGSASVTIVENTTLEEYIFGDYGSFTTYEASGLPVDVFLVKNDRGNNYTGEYTGVGVGAGASAGIGFNQYNNRTDTITEFDRDSIETSHCIWSHRSNNPCRQPSKTTDVYDQPYYLP